MTRTLRNRKAEYRIAAAIALEDVFKDIYIYGLRYVKAGQSTTTTVWRLLMELADKLAERTLVLSGPVFIPAQVDVDFIWRDTWRLSLAGVCGCSVSVRLYFPRGGKWCYMPTMTGRPCWDFVWASCRCKVVTPTSQPEKVTQVFMEATPRQSIKRIKLVRRTSHHRLIPHPAMLGGVVECLKAIGKGENA